MRRKWRKRVTDPELGRIGMTENEARASKRRLKIDKIPMYGWHDTNATRRQG